MNFPFVRTLDLGVDTPYSIIDIYGIFPREDSIIVTTTTNKQVHGLQILYNTNSISVSEQSTKSNYF